MEAKNFSNIPIIDGNGNLTNDFSKEIKLRGLDKIGKNYHIVSIIGTQSTGKSTLLNRLFGTSFDTLNSSMGRQQITKGIQIYNDVMRI